MYTNNEYMMVAVSSDSSDAAVYRKRGSSQSSVGSSAAKQLTADSALQQKMVAVRRKYHIYWRESLTQQHQVNVRKVPGVGQIVL